MDYIIARNEHGEIKILADIDGEGATFGQPINESFGLEGMWTVEGVFRHNTELTRWLDMNNQVDNFYNRRALSLHLLNQIVDVIVSLTQSPRRKKLGSHPTPRRNNPSRKRKSG